MVQPLEPIVVPGKKYLGPDARAPLSPLATVVSGIVLAAAATAILFSLVLAACWGCQRTLPPEPIPEWANDNAGLPEHGAITYDPESTWVLCGVVADVKAEERPSGGYLLDITLADGRHRHFVASKATLPAIGREVQIDYRPATLETIWLLDEETDQ